MAFGVHFGLAKSGILSVQWTGQARLSTWPQLLRPYSTQVMANDFIYLGPKFNGRIIENEYENNQFAERFN